MTDQQLTDAIHTAARKRQTCWLQRLPDPYEVLHLTRLLDSLYEDRRILRAKRRHGDRTLIVKRARIEVELERLAGTASSSQTA